MVGPYINSIGIISGSIIGILLGRHLPETMKKRLPLMFSIAAMTIGIVMIIKVVNLPPVILALMAGTIIGELLRIEEGVTWGAHKLQSGIERLFPSAAADHEKDERIEKFIAVMILFSFSGTGIFGSLQEGMSGDYTLLLIKTFMDFFTAIIFAAGIGIITATCALPQLAIQAGLFALATLIVPLTSESMLADFSAAGGMILLATGLRIADIKPFPVLSMIPALILSMPFTALWERFFS